MFEMGIMRPVDTNCVNRTRARNNVTDYGSIKVKVMGQEFIRLFNFVWHISCLSCLEMTVLWERK
jgi:hypothetical protein